MLANIRIVLIQTSHPGNIGSTARAMKTMGLTDLVLVAPKEFPHPKADEMSSNAVDILANAVVVQTLDEAIADCGLVVGTSSRTRNIPWPLLTPREFAEKARVETTQHKVAILFGREQTGLTNEELQRCHFHIVIPSNPDYSSLNLASAVQILAYELRVASAEPLIEEKWDFPRANAKELESFYEHLETTLIELEFLKPSAPRQLMPRLRRLFNRTQLDSMEINILRGILGAVNKIIASGSP